MTIEHKQITLTLRLFNRPISTEIGAYVCGGLALHEGIGGSGRTITHIQDSVAIVRNIGHPQNYLRPILQEMAGLTDWNRPYHEVANDLVNNQELGERYKTLLDRLAPGREPSVYRRKY